MNSEPGSGSNGVQHVPPQTFAELAASRREWIANVLHPWCLQASHRELKLAALEWLDIAGKVDADATLWTWAWSRFPALVHEGLAGVNETLEVRVTWTDGTVVEGFPDSRASTNGQLVLLARTGEGTGSYAATEPRSIDEIAAVERL